MSTERLSEWTHGVKRFFAYLWYWLTPDEVKQIMDAEHWRRDREEVDRILVDREGVAYPTRREIRLKARSP